MRPLRVFLCHSSKDKSAVRELYQKLCTETWIDPWLDEEKLLPGQDWHDEIEKAVETTDVVIVLLSKQSVSQEGYVQRELKLALDVADEKPENTIFIIPLRLDDCPAPRRLRGWHYVDYFPENRKPWVMERLLTSLKVRAETLGIKADTKQEQKKEVPASPQEKKAPEAKVIPQKPFTKLLEPSALSPKQTPTADRVSNPTEAIAPKKLAYGFWGVGLLALLLIGIGLNSLLKNPPVATATDSPTPKPPTFTSVPFTKILSPTETLTPVPTLGIVGMSSARKLFLSSKLTDLETQRQSVLSTTPTVVGKSYTLTAIEDTSSAIKSELQAIQTVLADGIKKNAPCYGSECAPTPTPTLIGSTMTGEHGETLVYVPAGEFTMGSDNGEADEKPVHTVYLDAFWIDQYEVTNKQYKACADAGTCEPPSSFSSETHPNYYFNTEFDDHPVIYVNWYKAKRYCEVWAGGDLPTEAQWEKAARGTDERTYPWGNDYINDSTLNSQQDTTKVGTYPIGKSPYGAFDMAGNVLEWVNDYYQSDYYATTGDSASNPHGPTSANSDVRVLRGGWWLGFVANQISTTERFRDDPEYAGHYVGFRCAHSQ